MQSGNSTEILLEVVVNLSSTTTIENIASVQAQQTDPNTSNNVASETTTTNFSPLATDDAYLTEQGELVEEAAPGVLENDDDPDGDVLTAKLVADVTHGILELNPDGSFSYLPNPDFVGEDSFTYVADDGVFESAPATVTLLVYALNHPPVGIEPTASITEGPTGTTTNFDLLVTLVAVSELDITVSYVTEDGSASSGQGDYQPISEGTLIIPAGSATGTISVVVNGDDDTEPDERFLVRLTNATTIEGTVSFTQDVATVTIVNDELVAMTRLRPAIDSDGIVVVEVVLDGIVGLAPGIIPALATTSLESFEVGFLFDSTTVEVLDVRYSGAIVEISAPATDPAGVTRFTASIDASDGEPELPMVLARIAVRLNGSVFDSGFLSLGSLSLVQSGQDFAIEQGTIATREFRRGDVQQDEDITIFDALYIAQCLANQRGFGDGAGQCNAVNAASVRQDGAGGDSVSIKDALFIAQYLVSRRNEFFENFE